MRTPLTLIDAVDAMVAQKHTIGYKYEAEEAILDRFVAFTHRQFPGLETITDASANAWIESAQKRYNILFIISHHNSNSQNEYRSLIEPHHHCHHLRSARLYHQQELSINPP